MTRRGKRPAPDDAPAAGHVGGRWRIRNWRLRTKLLAMLLIPAVAVLVLVALRATDDLDRAAGFSASAERLRVEATVAEAVHQLQRERDLTVRYVAGGRRGSIDELREQRARVDDAVGTFSATVSSSRHALSPDALAAFDRIGDELDMLTGLRYAGENTALPAAAVLRSYSELVTGVLDVGDQFVAHAVDDELASSRLAANALARVKDRMSVRRAVVAHALAEGRLGEDTERALLAAEAQLDAAKDDFSTFATPQQQRMYTDTVIGLVVDLGNGIVEAVLTRAENGGDLDGLSAQEWETSATYTINLVKQVQDALLGHLQQRSDALAAEARSSAGTDAGVVLGALLIAAILAVVITRSLLGPLKALRSSALDVAEHKLPSAVDDILTEEHPTPEHTYTRAVEPVPVYTREELGEVARAFDAVHGEAVRLAGEQAMLRENVNSMFVNLSRRSQDLVERQLTVLDRMEEHEQDPDILGGLYELDHLATRMRRNSENLLVLAGEDAGRPLPGSVPASEIIGAALSEVEHYQRIAVEVPPALSVRGDVAADVIHVIAELFENATAYSPEPVSVVSSVTRERQWRIDITDRGAGMPETEIRRANARMANPPRVDVEVSRRMGLFVVGRLAARHHVRVRLSEASPRGLTASVLVPADLIEHGIPESIQLPAPRPDAAEPEPAPHVTAPAPEQREPEPAPEPLPSPAPIGSVLAGEAEPEPPPRRTTVELGAQPAWPTEDDDEGRPPALEEEVPTDRLPAYRDLLSRWFPDSGELDPSQADGLDWAASPDLAGPAGTDAERTEPIPVAPAGIASALADSEADTEPTVHPQRHGPGDRRGERPPPVNRSPEAVRARMASLQQAVRRGRHARADEPSTTWP
ncbi:HAMP domain-containing protein [Saccharomonospora piscinae]|uniref:sensor histidine kinase n=1 Tax=Saccharomonospora piscinae TaxID=687388 RepID=UPI00110575F7|nr:nitrate- and nitrite sensing domain-containing protein [Saccharomonospora piscinae]TLW91557.1 HAMP domain-containing protein [Saccharomonospora piscinae]